MRGKSLALLVLALGCGLVASLGITQVLAKRGDPSRSRRHHAGLCRQGRNSLRHAHHPENVNLEQWPKDRVPAGAVIRQEDLDGRRTRQKIYAGEPMIEPKLLARGQVPRTAWFPRGSAWLPSRSDRRQSMADSCSRDRAATCRSCFARSQQRSRRNHLQDHLARHPSICRQRHHEHRVAGPQDGGFAFDPTGKTVSLLVTPAQAQIVSLASQLGTISLSLRSGEDSEQPKTVAMTFRELLGAAMAAAIGRVEDPEGDDEKRFREWAEMIRKSLQEKAKADPARPRRWRRTAAFIPCGSAPGLRSATSC